MISSLNSRTFLLLRKYGMTLPTRPKSPSPLWRSSSELLCVSAGSVILSLGYPSIFQFLVGVEEVSCNGSKVLRFLTIVYQPRA
jgi:hypothetical protein